MSARIVLQAAVVAHLREAGGGLLQVFDAPPVRAAPPFVVVGEPVLKDWSTATWRGFEGTLPIEMRDPGQGAGERPERLREFSGLIEEGVEALPRALGGGWRIVRLMLMRGRVLREREGWRAVSEFAVRLYREDG